MSTPSTLPLVLRKEIRDEAEACKKVCERIAKTMGVDAVKWDVEADAKAIVPGRKNLRFPFTINHAVQYMNGLADCLDKQCKDDLVKEAIVDAFPAKTISFRVYDSVKEGVKGLEMHSSYNGIQFLEGLIIVFTDEPNYATNIGQVSYEHDIIKLF